MVGELAEIRDVDTDTARKDKTCLMAKLIELGGDPACGDNEGRSCLHLAANNDSPSAVRILLQYKVRSQISRDCCGLNNQLS